MELVDRLTRLPHPADRVAGDEAGAGMGRLASLVRGAAGSSPHLAALIRRQGPWLREVASEPEAALAGILHEAAHGDGPAGPRLRVGKQRLGLLTALCDIGGVWPLETVTGALTAFADAAVEAALRDGLAAEFRRGTLAEDPQVFALAMGKMGAGELNYSSDIDLIMLFEHGPTATYGDRRAAVLRGRVPFQGRRLPACRRIATHR